MAVTHSTPSSDPSPSISNSSPTAANNSDNLTSIIKSLLETQKDTARRLEEIQTQNAQFQSQLAEANRLSTETAAAHSLQISGMIKAEEARATQHRLEEERLRLDIESDRRRPTTKIENPINLLTLILLLRPTPIRLSTLWGTLNHHIGLYSQPPTSRSGVPTSTLRLTPPHTLHPPAMCRPFHHRRSPTPDISQLPNSLCIPTSHLS
jgi:hypothetical protein